MADLVLTLLGPDRPGLVEAIADRVAAHGGNWVESRMAHLAGHFAGLLRVEVDDARIPALTAEVERLAEQGLQVLVARPGPAGGAFRTLSLDLVGLDRPGLVRGISRLLAERGVNIEELQTDRSPAAMSGEPLFRTRARIGLPPGADLAELRQRIEELADDLDVRNRAGGCDGRAGAAPGLSSAPARLTRRRAVQRACRCR